MASLAVCSLLALAAATAAAPQRRSLVTTLAPGLTETYPNATLGVRQTFCVCVAGLHFECASRVSFHFHGA